MKIGLLGGSFNPAHFGHIYISNQAIKKCGFDQVWWLVSPKNPLKISSPSLSSRVNFAKSLVKNPKIKVTDLEKNIAGNKNNYSYNSVKYLKKKYSNIDFYWIMGIDCLDHFDKWYKWKEFCHIIPIIVINRGEINKYKIQKGRVLSSFTKNISYDKINTALPSINIYHIKTQNISSSKIRKGYLQRQ